MSDWHTISLEEYLAAIPAELFSAAVKAAEDQNNYKPTARKRGRTPQRPYVPVIQLQDGGTHQIRGKAFATKEEALDYCRKNIQSLKAKTALKLLASHHGAYRKWCGLPYSIDDLVPRFALGFGLLHSQAQLDRMLDELKEIHKKAI
jgi:hypothetical protein